MTPIELPIRWVPKRHPHPAAAFTITIVSIGVAIAVRVLLVGSSNNLAVSSTLFPAIIVIAIYAGWRWSLGAISLLAIVAALAMAINPVERGIATGWVGLVMFFASAAVTAIMAGAVRELLIRLDEASRARQTAEEQQRESEERFRTLADSAPTLMWVTNPDRSRGFVNRAYIDFLGLHVDQALQFDWRRRAHPDDADRLAGEQVAGEDSRAPFTLEARYTRADGEWRWLRSISRPRLGASGLFEGFIGIAYDVTDAKRAEADLMRINDLLAERVESTLAERDAAQSALMQSQKLEALGQLTGGVAHDFNNLLTVVIGALDIILRHPEDESRRKRMGEAALAAARRGEQLTQQLLAFSRRQPLRPESVVIDDLLTQSEPLLRRAVGESLRLTVDLHTAGAVAKVDASQLEASVLNLVLNARDAVGENGLIRLFTERVTFRSQHGDLTPGAYLAVCVSDNGPGMDPETAAHAFEPFFTTKAVGKGTGLGLSQVYGFARQSGGAVEIESAVGKGATVRIILRAVDGADLTKRPLKAAHLPAPTPMKVLLVEDDADVAELVEAMLRELGHTVVSASDARSALHKAASEPELGLMLTDVIMPGGRTGVDLAREMTRLRPGLPVILSSGYTGETLAGAEKAPWPLLRKPYTLEALSDVIAETLHSRRLN